MQSWLGPPLPIETALGAVLVGSLLISLAIGRRGGRFRGLPGWVGFWVPFAALLVSLARAPAWISLTFIYWLFVCQRSSNTQEPSCYV